MLNRSLERIFALSLLSLVPLAAQAPTEPIDQKWMLRMDGNCGVVLPVHPSLDLGDKSTFMMWVYPERRGGFANLLRKSIATPGSDPYFAVRLSVNADGTLNYGQSRGEPGSQMSFGTTTVLPVGKWTHLAAVNDGQYLMLYVNGVLAQRKLTSGRLPVNQLPYHLGAAVEPPPTGFQWSSFLGFLSQFSIWNFALTPRQIVEAMDSHLDGHEDGLVGYWPMDDGPGYAVRDAGVNQLHARVAYPSRVKMMNGILPYVTEYQPYWVRTELWKANPMEWTLQSFPAGRSEISRIFPIDFDSDGDLDAITGVGWNPSMPRRPALRAFRNDGKGKFTEATAEVLGSSPPGFDEPTDVLAADVNHDGRMDLMVKDYGPDYAQAGADAYTGRLAVLIQTADGRLVDESETRSPYRVRGAHTADAADVDGDGFIDWLTAAVDPGDYFQVQLMMNDGTGRFTPDNSRLPSSLKGQGISAMRFLDADGDGDQDLFLEQGEAAPGDFLLLNDGTGHFSDAPAGALPPRKGGITCGAMRAIAGDLNQDGLTDLVISLACGYYTEGGFQVLLSRGDGTFEDATAQWLPDPLYLPSPDYADEFPWTMGGQMADLNGDGRVDLLVWAGSGLRPQLFLNNGSRLMNVSEYMPSFLAGGMVPIAADLNGDGRADILVGDIEQIGMGVNALYAGLTKGSYPAPASPATGAPSFLRLDILNDASLAADTPAPGMRLRIRGTNLGPAERVVFPEAPGAAPPAELGGVTVTFDGIPARLLSVSSQEILTVVPYALAGKWATSIRVKYDGRQSEPVSTPIVPYNPIVYGTMTREGTTLADLWKVDGETRTKITEAGQVRWGDRVAFRVTGAGALSGVADGDDPWGLPYAPANPILIGLGDRPWPMTGPENAERKLTPVSVAHAPDGLTGVVEVVVDLPQAQPPGFVLDLFHVRGKRYTRANVLPFSGPAAATPGCSYEVGPTSLRLPNSQEAALSVYVNAIAGCSWTATAWQSWTTIGPEWSKGTGTGRTVINIKANGTGAARTAVFTVAGKTVLITQP